MLPIEKSWLQALGDEVHKPYIKELSLNLVKERQTHTVYPTQENVFAAFNATPFEQVKVVLVGQDPYHGPGQAHGLSFSVQKGVRPPPSLKNIYKELQADLGIPPCSHGYLMEWANEGVLLLNSLLTVRAGSPLSHATMGWSHFTNAIIALLAQKKKNLVFLLWGKNAQDKVLSATDALAHHLVLKAAHPSPYSASCGFFGSRPFSQTNHYLKNNGIKEINWKLTE